MASLRTSLSNVSPDLLAVAIAVACLGLAGAATASTSTSTAYVSLDDPVPTAVAATEQRLFLEIFHGDRPTGLLAEMRLRGDRLWATPDELRQVGLVLPADLAADADGLVPLDALPGLSWRYDAAAQRLHLDIPATLRPQQA